LEPSALVRLERIAHNLPVADLAMRSVEAERGLIFFAYGTAGDGVIHGIWGYKNIGRTLELKSGTEMATVQQVLIEDAANMVDQLYSDIDPRKNNGTSQETTDLAGEGFGESSKGGQQGDSFEETEHRS